MWYLIRTGGPAAGRGALAPTRDAHFPIHNVHARHVFRFIRLHTRVTALPERLVHRFARHVTAFAPVATLTRLSCVQAFRLSRVHHAAGCLSPLTPVRGDALQM